MKSNFNKLPFLVSIIFLALSGYIFYFLYNKIGENRANVEKLSIEEQTAESHIRELRSLDIGLKAIDKEKTELEKHFVSSSNLVPFLDSIESLGSRVGAEAETSSVDISSDKASLLVGVKAKGTFESLYRFLTLVENSPYELEIYSLDLAKDLPQGTVETKGWVLQIKIKLISFLN